MLRQVLNRTLQSSKNAVFPRRINESCVGHIRNLSSYTEPRAEQTHSQQENFEITLCGQIHHVYHTEGAIVATLNTRVPNTEYYDAHRVVISKSVLQRHRHAERINSLEVGDRLYLLGRIAYSDFVTADSKNRQDAAVYPFNFGLVDGTAADDQSVVHDVNNVKLVGRVIGNPRQSENSTFLDVSTQYFNARENIPKLKVHSVILTDDRLRKVASEMTIGTMAIINGRIKTRLISDNNNRKKLAANIEAQNLFERRMN